MICPKCNKTFRVVWSFKEHLKTCGFTNEEIMAMKRTRDVAATILKNCDWEMHNLRLEKYKLEDSVKDLEIKLSFNDRLLKEYKKDDLKLKQKINKLEIRCDKLTKKEGFEIITKLEDEKNALQKKLKEVLGREYIIKERII